MKKFLITFILIAVSLSAFSESWERKIYKASSSVTGSEISLGHLEGYSGIRKFGANLLVSDSEEVIWPLGGAYTWPTTATTWTISSADVDDTSAGTGARTVEIHALDAD